MNTEFNMADFPKRGFCSEGTIELFNFIRESFKDKIKLVHDMLKVDDVMTDDFRYIIWYVKQDETLLGTINLTQIQQEQDYNKLVDEVRKEFNIEEYKIKYLNKFIYRNENNKVQSIKTKNSRPNNSGTTILRRGGQQITVGTRFKGNITVFSQGKTRIRSTKIRKNTIKRKNY